MKFPIAGAFPVKDKCIFTTWAPLKDQVEVVLQHDGVVHPMTRDSLGYWRAEIPGIGPGTRYFFRLDGSRTLPDPASRYQPEGVHGPSEVVAPDFSWRDAGWTGLSLAEMVIYEIHVGTFTSSHDFAGVIEKLPYLAGLGINAIELMPLSQFPGDRNWGYDGVFPFAVQHSYGGPSGLKKLVDAAHLSGIAVILDVVYNHQGPEGNYLGEFGPYFTDKYKTGWGQAINFDDAWCDGVRNFYWQNALMWLDEFHIDGLRLDAVHAIWDFSATHFIEELARQVRLLERSAGRKKVLIAEFDLNNPRYIRPSEKGGYNLDGQWIDEFHHALHSLVTGEVDGYYEDFGDASHLAKAFKDSYVYTGQYSRHRKRNFGRPPEGTTYDQFVVFAQNHDQVGNRMLGDRLSASLGLEALKLVATTYLLSPSVPMLFMGEEWGEKNPFQYFISHTDKILIEAVRKGRRQEFGYFNWKGEVPDPQSEKTFESCVLSWPLDGADEARALFSFYQHLIRLRKNRKALKGRTRDTLEVRSYEDNVLCIERAHEDDYLLIVLNFNKEPHPFTFPEESWNVVLNSASSQWGGPFHADNTQPMESTYQLHPHSVVIFEH